MDSDQDIITHYYVVLLFHTCLQEVREYQVSPLQASQLQQFSLVGSEDGMVSFGLMLVAKLVGTDDWVVDVADQVSQVTQFLWIKCRDQ